jgi:elongation factor Tu
MTDGFRTTVEDIFFIRGRGLVATTKVEAGTVRVGDEVRVNGERVLRVDGIEAFRKTIDQAQAGLNVGLLFRELQKGELGPGDVLTGAGAGASVDTGLPPPPPPPPTSGRDPRFAAAEAQRKEFLSMREAGLMTTEQIDDGLRGLMFALDGRHWVLNAGSDAWYSSDGGDWKHDTPPG